MFTVTKLIGFFKARVFAQRDHDGKSEVSSEHSIEKEVEGAGLVDYASGQCQEESEIVQNGAPWASLLTEALSEIFDRLPFEDRLKTVPLVCKDWRGACYSPASWRNVDMGPWIEAQSEDYYYENPEVPVNMDRVVHLVVERSCGQLRQLSTAYCSKEIVDYIAESCPMLRDLSLTTSLLLDDESASNLAERCTFLERLDLSDCYNISAKSLESFGESCPSLVSFARNMIRIHEFDDVSPPRGDEEAMAIGTYMVNLRCLELKRITTLTDLGLLHIAKRCQKLEGLNLACCSALSPSALDRVATFCPKLSNFVRPVLPRMHVDPKLINLVAYD